MAKPVVIPIVGDASQFRQEMSTVGGTAETTGSRLAAFGKVAAVALGAVAATAITGFVGDSTRAFSDLEQAVGGTEAVFGTASQVIDDFAKTSAESVGLSEAEFRDATTLIGGQLKRMTGDVQLAAEQSVVLTQTAADLAATYGGTTKQAVEALGSAFRGEADPAERFNLDLKIGRVNAKAVELGLADTAASVDDYARAQATLALITEQSTDAQGQFRREADTVAVQTQKLTADVENQKAAIGEALLPAQQAWLDIQKALIPVVNQLATGLAEMTGASQDLTGAVDENRSFWNKLTSDFSRAVIPTSVAVTAAQEDVNEALAEQISELQDDEQAARELAFFLNSEYLTAQQNSEDATEDTTDAIDDQASALLAAADPALQMLRKIQDLDDANRDYQEVLADSEASQDDVRNSMLNLLIATGEYDAAAAAFAGGGGAQAINALDLLGARAGVADSQIEGLIGSLRILNDMDVTATARINVIGGQVVRVGDRQISLNQEGGIATGPNLGVFGEAGNEALIPLDSQRGIDALAAAFKEALGDGVGTTINVSGVGGMDARELARQISLEARFS